MNSLENENLLLDQSPSSSASSPPASASRRVTEDELLRFIGRHPQGITTPNVAAALGARQESISSRLSRLYYYGKVDRELIPFPRAPRGPRYVSKWLPKHA